jgi:DNA-directed RNA polymerase specialized sigma24 family protein
MMMSQSDQDETLLVMLTQQGDTAAFEKLLRRLHAPMRQYVTRMVGTADADDVLQDVAFRIFRNVHLLREPIVFRAWAFRIATRIAFAYLKREKRWRQLENDPELIRTMTADRSPEHEQFDRNFLELIDRVSRAVIRRTAVHSAGVGGGGESRNISEDQADCDIHIPHGCGLVVCIQTVRS